MRPEPLGASSVHSGRICHGGSAISEDLAGFATDAWNWLLDFLPRIAGALAILIIGYILARIIARAVIRFTDRTGRLDDTLKPVIRSVIRYAIILMALVAALGQLGVQTASLLAALGAAGLAIGLALQGTLSNIASGLMLLWLRPFQVGEYIATSAVAGTVEEVQLFSTRIRTWDGVNKFVPNSTLWSTTITNYSRNPTRLILIEFGLAYENEISKGREILAEVAAKHPQVLAEPAAQVVPLTLGDSSVVLQMRAWSKAPDFWATRWDLTESGKSALEDSGLTIPFPQHVIHFAEPGDVPPAPPISTSPPVPVGGRSGSRGPSKQDSPDE